MITESIDVVITIIGPSSLCGSTDMKTPVLAN
jgi:hypothetical protein